MIKEGMRKEEMIKPKGKKEKMRKDLAVTIHEQKQTIWEIEEAIRNVLSDFRDEFQEADEEED